MELIEIVQNDIDSFLRSNRKLLFNERDFQIHLAIWLRESANAYDNVEVEYYIPYSILDHYIWENELRLDIVVEKDGDFLPIELKYKTKGVHKKLLRFDDALVDHKGQEDFQVMKNQGAKDLGMYDFWKDVRRIELIFQHFKRVKGGLAVFLTNDDAYTEAPNSTSNHYLFSMHEGSHAPQRHWQKPNSATARTHPPFTLEKEYKIR